ncbi:MAG TPA: OmpA family protein [Terriglobia bacterium]|nr:OmpA family protein [Terriglobia bacterium]
MEASAVSVAPSAQSVAPPLPPQAATPSPVAASIPAPPPAAPVSGAPVATQPKKSGNLFLKIVVAILAFIAVISVLVIGSCFYIGYRIKKKAGQVQQAYKKGDVGKIIGALGQDKSGSSADLGKILGALGQAPAQGGSGAEETVQEQPCPAVDPSQSKTFRDAAASASIPLVSGLTLSSVFTNKQIGGRDIESLETVQGINNNTVTVQGIQAVKNGLSGQRNLCIADLLSAHQYDTGFASYMPQTILGATMFSMSRATFEDLKAGRPALLDYFETQKVGEGRYRHWVEYGNGQLSRVEPQDVPYSIIVNGERKDLPAIHVKGKLGTHDTEAFVLDDPANPITLSLRMPTYNFYLNYLKITFPVAKGIQQQIAKSGCAAVYGIYFNFDSAAVRPESGPALKEVAEAIKSNPDWKLKIEGHTDNVGGDAYNLNLSNQRAAAVRQALVAHYQIDPGRVTSQGFGASRPKAPNTTPEGRALNRRVEVCRE